MQRFTRLLSAVLALLPLTPCCRAADPKPIWRVDLRQSQLQGLDEVTIRFVAPYFVIYSGYLVDPGSETGWVRHPRVVLDSRSGLVLSKEALCELTLPPWDECPRTRFRKAYPAINVIDCRKQMKIEEIGGIGLNQVEPAEFYLQEPGEERVLIFRAHKRCQPGDPRFISDEFILLQPCNDNVVVDKKGHKVYDMPKLSYYYLTVNREGTRFAVYERDISFFHPFGGTDRLRVKVFRSSDGGKLFDYRWHPAYEKTNDGRVALSDDGSLVGIIRGEELLVFTLPRQK